MKRDLITLTDKDLKSLQQKSLDMARYVVEFCKERDIRVFFFAGSLLGAVRHAGFIPWDDDIDLLLPSPDFDRFVEMWQKEADLDRYSLCLQTEDYNDHTLTGSIRDNNTTFITDSTVDSDVNQGLAIDILPLHACPKSTLGKQMQLILASGSALFKAGRIPARQSKVVTSLAKIILGIFRSSRVRYKMWSGLERLATKNDRKYNESEYVREFTMFPFIKWLYPRKWFDSAEWVKFEDAEVPIPVGAKEYLTKRYGNYMSLPPEKDRHPEHRIVFMDLDTPFIEYRGKEYFIQDN